MHSGGEDHADRVGADEPGDVREGVNDAVRMNAQADVAAEDVDRAAEPGDVRRLRDEFGFTPRKRWLIVVLPTTVAS